MAQHWTASDIPDLDGRTFVVTGANSGLGFVTACQLAAHGARVIMTARDRAKGEAACAEIAAAKPEIAPELRLLDLADLDSVRAFAAGLHDAEVPVDVLVNNAGVMMTPKRIPSKQGHELQFATNHLGHFALTGLLLDLIRNGRDPRVVTVSSTMHKAGTPELAQFTAPKQYSPSGAYSQSKLANAYFGLELQRRLAAAGSPVRSLLAHPGYAATNLQVSGPAGLMKFGMKIGNVLLAQSADQGALPQLYAATDPNVVGGEFFGPDGWMENRGYPKIVHPSPKAQNPELAAQLWTASEELTGVTFSF